MRPYYLFTLCADIRRNGFIVNYRLIQSPTSFFLMVDELQQYTDNTNAEVEDLRKKARQCADNGDYEMMEYYNNQADELEKNK